MQLTEASPASQVGQVSPGASKINPPSQIKPLKKASSVFSVSKL